MNKKSRFYLFISLTAVVGAFIALLSPAIAADQVAADSDAIAVRVLPNPNHYSAVRWYKSQNFTGSPQSLLVDGYDAVRDGRTVYVNAANVDTANKKIYTNIYLISYNQDPNAKTVDVLGQIISHWRFNSNLTATGKCYISTLFCQSDADCGQGYVCFNKTTAPGRCRPSKNEACFTDKDCANGVYCDSLRAKVARDIRRLGMLGDLRESLAAFKKTNNKYPILGAGTYLPLQSISVWPSWQSLFLPQIGSSQALIDPINNLGPCAGYDQATCWNAETKTFADPIPNNNVLELPGGSYAFVYSGNKNGSNFSLCAAMETKSLGYNTTEGQLADSGCVSAGGGYVGSSSNLPPVLAAVNLQGTQDQEFNGFIKVTDPDGDPLTWTINTAGTIWTNWKNNNQNNQAPVLKDTNNPNQKKIYAQAAGNPGTYGLSLTVTDGQGNTLATHTPIKITNSAPAVQADDIEYYPSSVIPLSINFSITDKDQPVSYTLAKASFNSGPYDILASSRATLVASSSNRVGDTVNYTLKYNLLTSNKISSDTNFVYAITARDKYSNSAVRQINLTVKADPPALDFNCTRSVRLGSDYYCGLGWQKQGDHTIAYSAIGSLPSGLSIGNANNNGYNNNNNSETLGPVQRFLARFGLSWHWLSSAAEAAVQAPVTNIFFALQGRPTTASSSFPIKIKAENEYGAVAQKEFKLSIDTYCGDHVRQTPNSEGRGGFYNDGQEDCDGNDGVIQNRNQIASSSPTLQYGCTTKVTDTVPYPIIGNQAYCTYLAPDSEEGGGYCGDGICQYKIMRNGALIPWEADTCTIDCGNCGENSTFDGTSCTCNSGWYDCDGNPGCESNTVCSSCGQHAALNGTSCVCDNGWYNCDGQLGCESNQPCPSGNCGINASFNGTKCVCNNGWHDCDDFDGCESTSLCGVANCQYGQYECSGGCYEKNNNNKYACKASGFNLCYIGLGVCNGYCPAGHFNCDDEQGGVWSCAATTCACGDNAHFNQNSGQCECNSNNWLMCGSNCYNPNTSACCGTNIYDLNNDKCCGTGFGNITCDKRATCCKGVNYNGGDPFCGNSQCTDHYHE